MTIVDIIFTSCFFALIGADSESLRHKSDLLWWSGRYEESREIAKSIQEQIGESNTELGAHLYRRVSRFKLSANYSGAILNNDRLNHEFGGRADINYWNANHLSISFQRLLRSYPGQAQLDDNQYSVAHSWVFSPSIYLEKEFYWSPSPQFSPKFSISGTPHYVFSDSTDLGVSLRVSHYSGTNVWGSGLVVRRDLPQNFYAELRGDFLFQPEQALAGQLMLGKSFDLYFFELRYGGGKTDEGNGILDHFHQGQFRAGWNILRWMKIVLDASVYRGGRRDEWKTGSGLEWYF